MPHDSDKPWHAQSRLKATRALIDFRNELREQNLHDTEDVPLDQNIAPLADHPEVFLKRTLDGTYNDTKFPRMGCVGARFGRNFPLSETHPDQANLLNPNPREVSNRLMNRSTFQPATILNLFAAAWIQFETHDWFSHGRFDSDPNPIEIPLDAADPWPQNPMRVPHSQPDPTRNPSSTKPPAFANQVTHWWDGSQIYGCEPVIHAKIRTGKDGKIHVQGDGRLPVNPETGIDLTGFIDNWWTGLSLLHALFALEHNAICDMLKRRDRNATDDELFNRARLINAALMAKIHTVEWTAAILPHPIIQRAMRTNWFGALGDLQKFFEGLDDNELLGGIIGSNTDHHAAPYSLTEDFVAVYRMHPLMPDQFTIQSVDSTKTPVTHELPELSGRASRAVFESHSVVDWMYSFGRMHPGALRLHNFPNHLRNHKRDDGSLFDLAAVDILRDRERGVPRYRRFRELIHMPPIDSFDQITSNPQWRDELKAVYNNDIDKVDLMTGLYAEDLPQGFGFSETAFRVFILMASRRLKSDRFFTRHWTPEVYTKGGLKWIEENGFASVMLRHFPALKPALDGVDNPFAPWKAITKAGR